MHLQLRITLALLGLAAIAVGTGSVLLLGYLLAGSLLGVMVIMAGRRLTKRLLDARLGRPRLLSGSPPARDSSGADAPRRAA